MFYLSHHIGNVIIPTDFHSIIFQRGRYTTNQEWIWWMAESPGNQVVLSAPAMLRWASPSHPSIVWFVKARTVCQVNERSTRGHRMSTSELPVEKHGTMRFWGYTPKNGTIFRRANDDSPISRYPMSFPWSGRGAVGSDSFSRPLVSLLSVDSLGLGQDLEQTHLFWWVSALKYATI